jgi:hypothetical protein
MLPGLLLPLLLLLVRLPAPPDSQALLLLPGILLFLPRPAAAVSPPHSPSGQPCSCHTSDARSTLPVQRPYLQQQQHAALASVVVQLPKATPSTTATASNSQFKL